MAGQPTAPAPPPAAPGGPLAGVRVVITRAEHQSQGLADALAAAGATARALPLLAILPPPDPAALERAAVAVGQRRPAWVVFTSSNAVDALLPRLPGGWPTTVAAAAVGPATALALARRGVRPSLVAARAQAEGVLAELLPRLSPGDRVLLPQAADARPVLLAGLRAAGVDVEAVVAYGKGVPPDAAGRAAALFGDAPLGWVTFTSPSVARAFAELFGAAWPRRRETLRAASIGPVTSDALRACGVEPAAEARLPTDAGLVGAIAEAERRARAGGGASPALP